MWARGVMRRLGEPIQFHTMGGRGHTGSSLQYQMRNAPEKLTEEGRARARELGVGQGPGIEMQRPWESIEKRQLGVRQAAAEGEEVPLSRDMTVGQQEEYLARRRQEQKADFQRREAEDEARQKQLASDREREEAKKAAAEAQAKQRQEEEELRDLRRTALNPPSTLAEEEFTPGGGSPEAEIRAEGLHVPETPQQVAEREVYARTGHLVPTPRLMETPEEKVARLEAEAAARAKGAAAGAKPFKEEASAQAEERLINRETRQNKEWDRRAALAQKVQALDRAQKFTPTELNRLHEIDREIRALESDAHMFSGWGTTQGDQKATDLRARITTLVDESAQVATEAEQRAVNAGPGVAAPIMSAQERIRVNADFRSGDPARRAVAEEYMRKYGGG